MCSYLVSNRRWREEVKIEAARVGSSSAGSICSLVNHHLLEPAILQSQFQLLLWLKDSQRARGKLAIALHNEMAWSMRDKARGCLKVMLISHEYVRRSFN